MFSMSSFLHHEHELAKPTIDLFTKAKVQELLLVMKKKDVQTAFAQSKMNWWTTFFWTINLLMSLLYISYILSSTKTPETSGIFNVYGTLKWKGDALIP